MAFKDFRPDFDYLKSLGFKETNTGKDHPLDRYFELEVNRKKGLKLCMNAFWDFALETPGEYYEKFLPSKDELEFYISILKDWRGDGMSFTNTLRMYEDDEPNKFIIDNGSSSLKIEPGINHPLISSPETGRSLIAEVLENNITKQEINKSN